METWTNLSDPVAHTKAPATWGLGILNNQKLLKRMYPYTGIARRVANQNIADSSVSDNWVEIEFDHVYVDEASYFNIASVPKEIAIPYKGRFQMDMEFDFGPSAVGVRKVQLFLDGVADASAYIQNACSKADENTTLKWSYSTAQRQAGSKYTIKLWQNSGGVLISQARVSIRCLLNET